jgi:hypothetical protein
MQRVLLKSGIGTESAMSIGLGASPPLSYQVYLGLESENNVAKLGEASSHDMAHAIIVCPSEHAAHLTHP